MKTIRIGHTPDADDAFMFYGINQGRVGLVGLEIIHELQPMQQLNRWSLEGKLEMTGGFSDKTGGAYVLRVGSMHEARQLAATDPLATSGSSLLTVYEWNTR